MNRLRLHGKFQEEEEEKEDGEQEKKSVILITFYRMAISSVTPQA